MISQPAERNMATSIIRNMNTTKSALTTWGTSIKAEGFLQGLLVVNNRFPITIWCPSTSDISARWIDNNGNVHYKAVSSGSLTFGFNSEDGTDVTVNRDGGTVTINVTGNNTMQLMYS